MPRYIRYLEDNEWKYASVKTVGDLSLLKTSKKGDVVEAINSLIDGGVLELVQGEIDQVQTDLGSVSSTVEEQSSLITNQQELISQLKEAQQELLSKEAELRNKQAQIASDLDGAKTELLNKADVEYVDNQLVKKVDASVYKDKYEDIENKLLDKVNLDDYQEEYNSIVDELDNKVNSIDYQSTINKVKEDVANQSTEIEGAKTDISNIDTKVDNVKANLAGTISTVQSDVDTLDTKVTQQKSDLESKITATQTKVTNDLATAKTELNTVISGVQSDVDTLEGTVASNKQELIDKIDTDVADANELIEEVEGRVAQTETNITNANTEISNAKKSIANTQTDLNTTKQNLTNVKTDLAGAKTDLSNTKTDLQGKIDTANQSITNLSNSVDTKIGVVNEDIEGLKTRASGIEGDITTINREVDEAKGELSTTITNLENVDGRLAEAETKVTQNAEGLTTKVSQSSYDADKLATDERLSTAETTIEQHSDAISLKAEKSDVYNKTETNNKLGTKVDSQTFNNKISEIKVTTDGITQNVSNLQKTTSGQETRLKNAETTIDQHSDQIALKASQEEVDSLSGDLETAQAELLIQAGKIASKVEKTDYDALEGRVTNQQATVEQLADSITQKVERSDYDELTQQVSDQETSILQTASQVETLATKSEDIDGRLTNAEASITTQAGQIDLKATQSEMDSVKGRVTKAEGDITTQAGQIALKASKSDMDSLTGRVSTAEGKITTQAGQINLKAEKKDVYTKTETDTKLGKKIDSSVYNDKMAEIDLTTDGITQRVTATEGEIDTATGDITNLKTDVSTLEQTATQIQTTVSGIQDDVEGIDGRLSTTETQVTQNKNAIALKASQTDMDTVTGRVDDAEAQLEVQAGQISSKVEKTTYTTDKTAMQKDIDSKAKQSDLSNLNTRMTTAESNITQTAEAITSKVEQDDFDTLSGTVESQGTTIAQHSSQIALKAEKSNVYSKGETDTKLGGKVDNTTYNNKMAELKVTTDGISQEVSNVKGTVSTQGGQITELDKDISTVDQKADSIQQQVTSLNTTVTDQGEIISSQGTSITQLNGSIALKAEKKDVYTKAEADGKIDTAVSSAKSEIRVTTDGIKQDVSKVNTTLGDHDDKLVNQQSSIEQLADSISQKVEQSDYDQTTQKMAVQETEILQNKSDIALLANRTTESEGRLEEAEASIQINSDAIESKVEKTDFDNLKGTVTAQGTTISQHSDQIKLKAEASNVYSKTDVNNKLSGKVDNTTYNNKMAEIEVTTDSIKNTVSDVQSDLNTTNSNVSKVDQKADSISQSVTSLSSTVTDQGKKITNQGTSISQLNESIALKAEKSDVYTKNEADNKVSSAVNTAKSEIKLTTDGIKQSVSNVDSKINNMTIGAENILRNTAIKKDASYFNLGVGVTRDISFLNRGLNTFKYDVSGLTGDAWRSANPVLIEAKEGEVFSASAEVYIPTGHGIDMSSPTLEMQFYKEDGTRISAVATSSSRPNLSLLDQWQKVTTENIKAPAGTVKANARVWLQRNGKIWVSHLMMSRGTKVSDWSPSFLDTDIQFEDVNKSISTVDQKADGIKQTVSNLTTTVNSQGSRISNAETTIGQHTNSINLKANASDVYTKSQVDTNLGKKVDTTTYNNKMSEIKVTTDGIKQTASNQQTTINKIDGTVSSHTSQISTLDQRADGFDLKVKEVEGDIDGVKGRVSTAETQITANKNAIALKASSQSVSDLGNRVGTAEGKIQVNANQIAQRVTKTEMDNAVGVNKWVASRYDMNLGSSSVIPTFSHIKGKTPSSVIDYSDASKLQPFSGDYYVGHYFTNIYMNTAKTVNLSVANDDGASIFLNGASIYGRGSSTSALTVAVVFRAGWNTIEILHYEHSGAESVNLGLKLSDNVDKMTSVIGVGDKNETRLTQAETSIVQNASDIALRATKTEVTAMGNRVTNNESAIKVANDKISSKVEQSDFNNYSKKLTTAESNITQLKDSITTKVEKTDFNLLNNTVKSQGTSISQLNESIALKVNSDVVDGLKNRVSSAETQITANKNAIALKASQSDLDKATGRLSNAEASINLNTTAITQRVKQTEFDGLSDDVTELSGRMTDAETTITQTAKDITLKADKATTYTKTDVDNKIGDVNLKISNQATEIKQTNDAITLKANKTDVYTKTESSNLLANKTDKSDFNAVVTRVSNAEASLKVANDNIKTKVAQSTFDVLNDKVSLNTDSTNYNPNPSFEGKKATGYTSATAFASTDSGVPTGAPKKYVGRQTGRDNYINDFFSVKAGDKFIVEGWIASTDSSQSFGLGLNTQDDAGNNFWLVSGHKSKGTGAWQYFKQTYTIPSGKNKARFFSQINASSSFGNWYFTDVRVTKVIDQSQVDGLETKLSTMQTNIDQTSSAITLKANASEVYTKGQTDTKVNAKANQSDLNTTNSNVSGLTTRMTNAEASLKVQAGKIESKVEKQEFDKLSIGARNYFENGNFATGTTQGWSGFQNVSSVSVISSPEYGKCLQVIADSTTTSRSPAVKNDEMIDVQAGEEWTISFWAKRAEAGTISCLMKFRNSSNVESNPVNAKSVEGAKDTWVYFSQTFVVPSGVVKMYATPRVSTSIASLKFFFANFKIEKGNRATDFSPNPKDVSDSIGNLDEHLSEAVTRITQTEKDIAIKANKTDVYTKNEANNNVSKAITDAKAEIKVTTDGIKQSVTNLSTTVSGQASTISSHSTSISQLNSSITSKAEKSSVYTKAEADGKISTAITSAKSEIKQTTDGITSTVSALDTKVGSISVGARNLLEGSGTDKYKKGIDDTMSGYNQYYAFDISHVDEKIEVGDTLTISFDVQMQTGSYLRIYDTNAYKGKRFGQKVFQNIGSKKTRLSWTFVVTNEDKGSSTHGLYFYNNDNGDKFTIEKIKIEKGNIPTDWTPAPEDVDQRMDDITIGARNLLLGTGNAKTVTGTGGTNETTNVYDLISKDYSLIAGKQVTVSFDIVFSVDSGTAVLQYNNTPWGYLADRVNASKTKKHYSFTKNLPTDGLAKGIQLRLDGVTGTATVSNVKLEFGNKESAWSPAFEDIQVGGRNKILNSSFKNGTTNWSSFGSTVSVVDDSTSPTGKTVRIIGSGSNGGIWYASSKLAPNGMEVGKEYTVSIIAKGSGKLEFGIERIGSTSTINLTSDYRKYTVTQLATSAQNVVFYLKDSANAYIHSIKLEEGNCATEWTPAPEDTNGEIDSLSTQISQTAKEVSINVVKKNNVLASINASGEGIKIKGDKIDISGAVTFSSLNSDMQSKVNAGTSAKTAIDNLDVGGTNLLTGTNFESTAGFYKWGSGTFKSVTNDSYVGFNYLQLETKDDSGNNLTVSKGTAIGIQTSGHTFRVIKGRQYTVSMIIATSELNGVLDYLYLMHGNGSSSMNLPSVNTYNFPYVSDVSSGSPSTRGYYKVSYTFTADVTDDKAYILVGGRTTRDLSGSIGYAWIRISQLQVEEGNKATGWSLNPMEIYQGIGSAQSTADSATSKANSAQSTANTANSKAGTAQSTADSATTKANNAQSTANTANSTANYAKTTVDNGKSKWEGAYNLTQTWRRGNTTEIDGGNISTRSIQAQSMIMADFTNLCENPDFEYDTPNTTPMGFTGGSNYRVVDISAYSYGNGSNRALQIDASSTASSSSYMSKLIPVSAGQQFYVGAEGRYYNANGSGTGRIGFKTYDGKQSSDNHWYTAVQWSGTKNQTFGYKSGTFTVPEGVSYLQVWISFSANETTNNSFIIDNIRIHRMANAELIVDGVIEGRHIKADSISFDKAKGGTLKLGGAGNVNGVLEVYSSEGELIANLDGDKGGFTSLYVADFESPTVVEYGSDNLNFYVSDRWLDYPNAVDPSDENDGAGWARPLATIAEALRRIPKYFDGTATISLPYNGVFYENIDVMGFLGIGNIYINGGNGVRVNGNVRAYKNLCSIYFKDFTVNGTSGSYANVQLAQNPYANLENIKVYGNNSQRCMDIRESGYAQLTNCEVYDSDYAICVRYGANCYMTNCRGYGNQYGVQIYGGILMGAGTCPAGGKGAIGVSRGSLIPKNYSPVDLGKDELPYAKWVDIFTANRGSASPPPAPETVKTFTASSGNSWRDNFSGQWYNQGVVAQGYYGGYGVYRGLWFLGSSLSDTLKGKTIKSMRVYVKRTSSGGNSGSVTCYFRSHNYTSQPSGKPTLGSKYTTSTFKWGEGKWINIPSSMWADFTSGTAKGIGIWIDSTSNNNYARFGTSIQVEVTYK
ncbi:carbohydrate binding domain-containing protein [Priestia megaterium]|uniref:carbohydrate binding domain-containing protein n=1 Tax=Priestia megaterium TaxID=1404 RepID=UPI002E22248A|nr:carbohydrate binding domain-containing protein [Priestia megaterium]MED3976197.1 carbohydrate binding domain-containing protein [Priestia megaterium]